MDDKIDPGIIKDISSIAFGSTSIVESPVGEWPKESLDSFVAGDFKLRTSKASRIAMKPVASVAYIGIIALDADLEVWRGGKVKEVFGPYPLLSFLGIMASTPMEDLTECASMAADFRRAGMKSMAHIQHLIDSNEEIQKEIVSWIMAKKSGDTEVEFRDILMARGIDPADIMESYGWLAK